MSEPTDRRSGLSRRGLFQAGAAGSASFVLGASSARAAKRSKQPVPKPPRVTKTYDFNQGWRFGGVYSGGSQDPGFPDHRFRLVTLPHTVVPLSWGNWNPAAWEQVWIYRKHFSSDTLLLGRTFIDFDGVMTDATVYLNGTQVAQHQGGYLPFSAELTDDLLPGANVLAVVVNARWLDAPPDGGQGGPGSIDYLQPGGIYRDVTLRVVPDTYISDVWAKPQNVLSARPDVEVQATVDAAVNPPGKLQLTVELLEGKRVLATRTSRLHMHRGTKATTLRLTGLSGIRLWSPEQPQLYTVRVTLSGPEISSQTVNTTIGFREAVFQVDGFYLNGERLQIFGLNRHQLYPYTGMAASARLEARDAELIKNELGCNMVRCSHYPQSPHFLDACDENGLMVWEEPPGWQYIGDPNFDRGFLQNVSDMVVRDRNRPSVIVWGTRLDETGGYPTLYGEARQLAYDLDGTRQTTGAIDVHTTQAWAEDVFAYDDYHTDGNGNAILEPPIPGVPYLVSEAVGAIDGPPLYRWIDTSVTLATQARLHAQVQQIARSNPAYTGLIAWCAVDYASLVGGDRVYDNLRWPGVLDSFRVPKPGAAFYRSQHSPAEGAVILPAFYWDFGAGSPATGPGPNTMLATNCEELAIYVGGVLLTTATPDTQAYGSLAYPPVIVDLTVTNGSSLPDLVVYGYINGTLAATLQMSSNPAGDHLAIDLEDTSIAADGSDATRVTFRALDAYGNQRPYVTGGVSLSLTGPADLIAQNPFDFAGYGGVGGAIIRSLAGRTGRATITATHATLGRASAQLLLTAPGGEFL